jgi:hypothetical protein
MTTKTLMLALLLCAVAAPVLANDPVALDGTLAAWMRPVKNAPYSAQVVREHAQTLADGNQIDVRRGPMAYYRDSAGRTRQEFVDDKGELRAVRIDDPAAGVSWTLKPQERVAIKLDRNHPFHEIRKDGTLPSIERRATPDGQQEVIVKRVVRADAAARRHVEQDVRIQLSKTMAAHGIASLASAFDDAKWSSKATTKDLGTRDFGGIKAEGRMRSYEIPAGAIGNRNPIVVSDETWTAPDLQVTVYTKHSDPRSGDVVFRLENVKREEPAAALFTVPADYTVREAGSRWRDWTSGAGAVK